MNATPVRTLMVASPYFPPSVGGVETYVDGLARAMNERPGWRVFVVTSSADHRKPAYRVERGLGVYRLPAMARFSYTPLDPRWPLHIARIIRAERPDYINVHTPVPGLPDVVGLMAGRTPLVVTYHAATLRKPGQHVFNAVARAYAVAEAPLLRRARLVLGVSEYVSDILKRRLGPKVGLFENAVDAAAVRTPTPMGQRDVDVAFIARLDPTHAWKGLDQLLDAARIHQHHYGVPLCVHVVGDGADRPRYEERARHLGIDRAVHFLGNLGAERKFAAIRRARSLVLCPTSANDAFPTVMLEAWASGVPVIASAIGPITSLVDDGETGLLVPAGQPAEIAAAVRRIVTEPGLGDRLAAGGARRIATGYTWERRGAEFASILESLG